MSAPETEPLGQRIRRLRMERRLGLNETSRRVGISCAFLSRVESGKEGAIPSERNLSKIAEVIGDDFYELMHVAGRIPWMVTDYIKANRGMVAILLKARRHDVSARRLKLLLDKAIMEVDE